MGCFVFYLCNAESVDPTDIHLYIPIAEKIMN